MKREFVKGATVFHVVTGQYGEVDWILRSGCETAVNFLSQYGERVSAHEENLLPCAMVLEGELKEIGGFVYLGDTNLSDLIYGDLGEWGDRVRILVQKLPNGRD